MRRFFFGQSRFGGNPKGVCFFRTLPPLCLVGQGWGGCSSKYDMRLDTVVPKSQDSSLPRQQRQRQKQYYA